MYLCVVYGSQNKQRFFPTHYELIGVCDLNGVCLLRATNWMFENIVNLEERSIFWEVVVMAIWGRRAYEHYLWFWTVTKIGLFEYPDLTPLDFCLWGCMKVEVYKIKMDTWDEFPAGLMCAAVRIKKYENQLRRTTRDLRTRVVEGDIFGNFFMNCNCHFCATN